MELHEIKKEYQFNQKTFYRWLRENGMIEKTTRGYVIGENTIDGMETLETKQMDANGEIYVYTQVTLVEWQIPMLVRLYVQSGLPNLYARKRKERRNWVTFYFNERIK